MIICLRVPDYHRLWCNFPEVFHFTLYHLCRSYNPTVALTTMVWAVPRSLATTSGVSVDFLSSGYLDVSVPRVCSNTPMYSGYQHLLQIIIDYPRVTITICQVGCPIRRSMDRSLFPAPHGLSQGITSFIASCCQGIHQTPFSRLI